MEFHMFQCHRKVYKCITGCIQYTLLSRLFIIKLLMFEKYIWEEFGVGNITW